MIDQEKCEIEEMMIEFQWRKLLCAYDYEYDGIEAEDENQKMRTGKKNFSFREGNVPVRCGVGNRGASAQL